MHKRTITICLMALVLFSCTSTNKVQGDRNDIAVPTGKFDFTDTIPKITIKDISLAFPQIIKTSITSQQSLFDVQYPIRPMY